MPNLKILVTFHDVQHPKVKSDILTPIQTGCACATKFFKGMLRDDDGENISDKNIRYCELSAQYWAWKNYEKLDNPDYIGFMHYRRYFIFDGWKGNPDLCWLPKSNFYFVPDISASYKKHVSDDNIRKTMQDCDCLVIKPYDVRHIDSENIRTQFCKLRKQKGENFDIFIATAKKLYPEYIPEIEKIENGSLQYLCNMFVMRKDLFFEYNKFCFDILDALDKQIDSRKMDEVEARFLGYFGEFLLSIFIFKLQKDKKINIKEVEAIFLLNNEQLNFSYAKYWKYKILSKITWGNTKKHYKTKYGNLKFIRKNA